MIWNSGTKRFAVFIPNFNPSKEEGYIRLVTHNYQAQRINDHELEQLPGRSYPFRATIDGKFPEYSYPTDEVLELKRGAQIMFVKNDSSGDHRFYNGMIGEVTDVNAHTIEVRSKESDERFVLQEEEWTNAKYVLDEETKEITEDIEGVFKQYPVKLAWAITIHKSQGLTFERAIIDASASFAHGQTYVALSRCRTLEGLVLSAPLSARAIISDSAVDSFTTDARRNEPDENRFRTLQQTYFLELLSGLFDFLPIEQALRRYIRLVDEHLYKLFPKQLAEYKEELERFNEKVTKVAQKFSLQYTHLIDVSQDYAADDALQARIHSGTGYFKKEIQPLFFAIVSLAPLESDNRELKKKLKDAHEELRDSFLLKDDLLGYVCKEGFHTSDYLKQKAIFSIEDSGKPISGKDDLRRRGMLEKVEKRMMERQKEQSSSKAKNVKETTAKETASADILHPELYHRLVGWRNAEASQLGLPVYTVIQQKAILGISNLLPSDKAMLVRIPYFGKKGVEKYGDIILEMVRAYRKEKGLAEPELLL